MQIIALFFWPRVLLNVLS